MRSVLIAQTIVVMVFLCSSISFSQSIDLQGQLSGWMIINENASTETQVGIRYISGLFLEQAITDKHSLDIEISLNAYRSGQYYAQNKFESEGKIKPYRLWLRFVSSQFETRLGLQKINFGSATLLRPLMWFDRIDPRDPLQLTDGVYGVLSRYYFLNNANIWLWGLYGNEDTKGWEIFPNEDRSIEYGGRFQYPVFTGEIAFTYHHRRLDMKKGLFGQWSLGNESAPESRFALDGKWDIGVGVWIESAIIRQETNLLPFKYQNLLNVGLDYSFNLGNGLHVLAEHLIIEASDRAFRSGESAKISAIYMNYPFGLVDQMIGIFYYDWENHDLYRFLSWQRIYDNWSFHVIGFWNPDQNLLYRTQSENNYFTGKGFQILIVFNH